MIDNLMNRAHAMESIFFARREALIAEQKKELKRMEHTKKALYGISGIKNRDILQKFVELDISPEVAASLALIPLVLVAWADGEVDDKERKAVLENKKGHGIAKDSVSYTLLDEWLKKRPPNKMLAAWTHYISGLCESLNRAEREELKANIMKHAAAVAGASGGFLSIMKISPEEEGMLAKFKKAFDSPSCRE